MGVENNPQFSQRIDREPRAAHRDRCTNCGIAHPRRDLTREPWPDLDIEDLTAGTPLSAVNANFLAMQRMPGVRHHNKLRLVC